MATIVPMGTVKSAAKWLRKDAKSKLQPPTYEEWMKTVFAVCMNQQSEPLKHTVNTAKTRLSVKSKLERLIDKLPRDDKFRSKVHCSEENNPVDVKALARVINVLVSTAQLDLNAGSHYVELQLQLS